ncbi:MAG TPA: hypothetical protein VJY15_08470, partial [Candidatus Acidoferrum sp.]|nr:hypothetical protein [Candidatus Acidoferrum sp.]
FRLSSEDPWSATWTRPRKLPAFNSDAWGVRAGEGRSESWERGTALYADQNFLRTLLKKLDRSLLLLIKLQHLRKGKRFGDEADTGGSFTHSWVMVAVNKLLETELFGLDDADKSVVAKLSKHSRFSFRDRYQVLSGE